MPLKLRRGTSSNRTSITPAEGEPIYTTDTKKLYIGDGSTAGGVVVDTTGVSDGDKGDITVSSSGATWTIDNDAVTYAKIQNVSATDRLLGRSSAGAGDIEEITCTSAGRALIDDADATAQRTTLGLGTLATQSGTFSGTSSGTNTGDQTITLTGDVTGSGTGSFAATIANDAVTYAKMQNVSATDKILGRSSAGAGDVEEITCTSAGRALLDDADAAAQRTTLGLGTLATQSGTFSGTSSGTNTGDQNLFSTIAVSGQSNVVADATSDTLTLVAGSNITITTNDTTDTITIASTATGTIDGSGAANKLAIWSDSDTLTSDTNLHWDTTNDRLGIKTATPNTSLQVAGGGHITKELACGLFNWEGDAKEGRIMMSGSTAEFSIFDRSLTSATTTAGDRYVQYNSSKLYRVYTDVNNDILTLSSTGSLGLGIGSNTASARIHAISTTEQLRVGYDTSNYASATVGSTGTVTLDAVGSGAKFVFSDAVEVPDSAYASGWNGSVAVPTRNAVYDRVQDVALAAITFIIDGGGSAITTGIKGDLEIPFACTIEEVIVLADQTGSIVVDIWKDTYANFPPTDADSITASATPTLSSAIKAQNNTLTGWTTSITAGDILRFNVDSATTVQRVSIILQVRK
jgi:hypothetical protein